MASKTIKGLTVEIGGDTTKLGKALKDVESKSRSLSKELGDINKLLKLDPGNTDLLAQKQEVLAAAVENTRKKLETLKEAEKQVQEQFERGDVSEEQLRALQREIVATENKISNMTGWVIGKIQSFSGDVLSGIKNFFGIHSPSRVFRDEVGAMLAEGMAEGITENAKAPLEAMDKLSRDLLGDAESFGGITLERRVETTFGGQTYTKPDVLGTLGRLESLLSSFSSFGGLSVTLNIEHFENKAESDLDEIADYVASKIQTKITKKGAAFA